MEQQLEFRISRIQILELMDNRGPSALEIIAEYGGTEGICQKLGTCAENGEFILNLFLLWPLL